MKSGVNKVRKVTQLNANLNAGIKGGEVSKIWVFVHFLRNGSLKMSNFLHDGRRQ